MQRSNAVVGTLCSLVLLALSAPAARAQQTGSVTGVVRPDQQEVGYQAGAAGLSAVEVSALDASGNVAGSVLTDDQGGYRLFLRPGTYTIVFSVPGWQELRRPNTVVAAGESVQLSVALKERAYDLNPITVTASKTEEKALDAPAAVEVKPTRDIIEQPATTVAEHVKNIAAVDVIKTGLQGNYVVVRGFNNIFSGATLTLTDNRIARVPSLRANVLSLNPTTNLDIERVEVVLGPGSALYGPNAANGVIHTITKSPIDYPGGIITTSVGVRQQDSFSDVYVYDLDGEGTLNDSVPVSYDASSKPVYQTEARYAMKFSDRFGVKLSGQYFRGEEYRFLDPDEVEQQTIANRCLAAGISRNNPDCANFAQGLDFGQPESFGILTQSIENVAGGRDDELERWTGEVRADWRPTADLNLIGAAGRADALNSIDLTGLGGGQVIDWAYDYVQLRGLYKSAFAQVFMNRSNNDQTYLLRTGRPLTDKSRLLVAQVQNTSNLMSSKLVYGVDYLGTHPATEGTINGQNEADDDVNEIGGYVQSQTSLSDQLELMLAARVDKHSILNDPVFSPRAGIVWKPTPGQSVRATYNRAFSTPTTLNLFLDISGGTVPLQGALFQYDVRAQGTTANGLNFRYDTNGVPMHRSPFGTLFGSGANVYQPTTTPQVWNEIVQVVKAGNPSAGGMLESLPVPTASDVAVDLRTLNPTTKSFYATPGGIDGLTDIPVVAPTITNTFEVGYKGLLGDKVLLGINGYYSLIDDFTSALRVISPNVFLNPDDVEQYLLDNGVDAATAQSLAVAIGGNGADVPGIPVGVITPENAGGTDPALVLTYENLGRVDLFGADMSATVIVNDQWEIAAGAAWVSDNQFVANEGTPREETIPLNAPTTKLTGSVRYRNDVAGFNGQVRGRHVNGFPANSGVYTGQVDGYNVMDLTLGYRLPGALNAATLTLDMQNVLDHEYQTFVGTPRLGRFTMLRLMYEF